MTVISIFAIEGVPIITSPTQFYEIVRDQVIPKLQDHDILLCAHTPLSRIFNHTYDLNQVKPSSKAIRLAEELHKDPRHVEVILRESREIVKMGRRVIVTENRAGVVCANGGIDQSNAGIGKVIAVPPDPDRLAHEIRSYVSTTSGKEVAVIITDTVGRALRRGAINIAIGIAGISAMKSEIGKKDLFGYTMRVSEIAVVDELASAAELIQGQTDEATPLVIIRGYNYGTAKSRATQLNRPKEERIFQ